jgi:phosphonate metabolism-associated iron-containing alcohol dehydrogenase
MNTSGFSYFNPVKIYFGVKSYKDILKKVIRSEESEFALFYGENAMKKIGVIDAIKNEFSDFGIKEFGNINSNPDIEDIEKVLSLLEETNFVVGIGGGSVLDFAKTVAFISNQSESLRNFLLRKTKSPAKPSVPFIAIPTTSGTGSEVTPWASIWDFKESKKYSLSHELMFPEIAIVDPYLTQSLPSFQTAYTGYDALSHALEAFWSRCSNPISDLYAIEAVRLILSHLQPLIENLQDIEHRVALSKASLYAGLAFSNTKTTAVHSVSYPMTLHYRIPHGVACALTLAEFWEYNLKSIPEYKIKRLFDVVDCKSSEDFKRKLKTMLRIVGLPDTLKKAGIPNEGIDIILDEGFHPERVTNNPIQLTRRALKEILEKIYE